MPPAAARALALVLLLSGVQALPAPGEAEAAQRRNTVRFETDPGGSLLVHGRYPPSTNACGAVEHRVLHERYRGDLEVGRAPDGSLFLIGELSFQDYLKGLAEVPRDWPMEALKAQVVAARTYALHQMDAGGSGGTGRYDLCATDACQVYAGMRVEAGPRGERWIRAVDATAGEALLHGAEPALTLYSSTSPGRTFDADQVFGGEPRPYLQGMVERDDRGSPLARWRVELPFSDLARFLAADGRWSGRRIRRVDVSSGRITVVGRRERLTIAKEDLRTSLNRTAHCVEPARYPPTKYGGYRLPLTVPSKWFRAERAGGALVLHGRGWGHGVGMVQWGARGKAERGLGYADILAAYYGGLRPQRVGVLPTIRILVAEGLRSVTVAPSGSARVRGTDGRPAPPWTVSAGRRLRLRHASAAPPPQIQVARADIPRRLVAGERFVASMTVSDDVRLRLEFLRDGEVAGTTPWRPVEEGAARVSMTAPPLAPGRYRVRGAATDGVDLVHATSRTVSIRAGPSPSPTPEPAPRSPTPLAAPSEPPETGVPVALVAGAAMAVALALLLLFAVRRRKGLHRA